MDYNNFLVNAYTKMRILDRNISDGLSKIAPKDNTALSTAYQAVEGFSSSAMKSLESTGDFALQLIAGATKGWLPEVSESVSSFAQRDLVDEGMRYYSEQGKRPLGLLGALAPSVSKQVYDMTSGRNTLDDVNVPLTQFTLQDVIDNVGAMLPSVALGFVGGQALSLGMLGTSAAGQATNEALAEGAPIGKALGYGTLSGATEVATEMMVDPFKLFGGSGFFDNILPSTGPLGKLATSFLGEGAEEMVSEVVNPALKSIYQGRTALEKYTTKEGRKELLSDTVQAGIMGGVVSLAMAPLGAVTNTKQNRVAEQYETISNNAKRLTSLDAAGKLTERQRIKMESTTAQAKSRISDLLSSMDAQTRANTIDRLNLSGLFNEDGSVKNVQAGKKAAYQSYGAELNGDLAELANKAQVELAESEDLDENKRETFRQVLKSFAEVRNAGYDVDALAVVKDNGTQQGITIAGANKGGLIFINENRLNEINDALQTLTHELTHSLPKTTAVLTLLDKAMTAETMGEHLAGTMADIAEEYGWTRDEVTGAVADYRAGKITPENDRIVSELIANFTEDMIGLGGTVTESFNRLVRNDEGLIVRAYNSIRDMIALHKAVGNDSGVTRQAYRDLIGYEKTFRRAMELAGIDVARLAGEDEEETRYFYFDENNSDQVKSDTDNIGTFDSEDPDILYSRKLTEEEKAKRQEEQYAKKRREEKQAAREGLTESDELRNETAESEFDLDAVNNLIAHKEEIVRNSEQAANLLRSIAVRADKLRGYANRKYREDHNIPMSANLITNEEFKSLAEKVTNIFKDDMISPQKVRKNISEIAFWFSKDNEIYQDYLNELKYADDHLKEYIENDIADSLEILQEGYDQEKGTWNKETLSVQELKAANDILRFVENFYTRYDTIWEEGKRRSAKEAAKEYRIGVENGIKGLELDKNGKPKGINGKLKEYLFGVTSPMTVAKMLDGYADDGFYQHYVERMQKDSWAAQKSAYEVTKDLQDFVKKTKGYKKRLAKERIQIGRYDFLIGEVIDIYLQWTQENGKLTISKGAGINYTTKNGNKSSVSALLSETDMNLIENSFTKEDWKFVNLLKKIYLDGGKIAGAMDMRILGFTDKDSPNYYQLTRDKDFIKGNIGDASRRPDINSVANKSINKKRSKHAKRIPLLAQNAYEKAMRYVHDSTTYGYMAEDLMNFKKIYYRDVSDNTESYRSIQSLTQQEWDKSNKYWSKYLNDVQGVKSGTTSEIVSWIRSGYAQANLGMNIKVIFGQFASYPTAGVYLSTNSMLKGVFSKTDYEKLDEYSMIAKVRGRDRVVVKAETVTDTLNAVGKYGTLGIQWADRGTIGKVWNACQYEIESQNHLKRGTEENYKAAAELFDRVITETQPTYQDADRSAFQRSDKEMAKFFSAFTSVPMKQISLLVSAYDEIRSLKQQKKNHVEISDERLQTAKKKAAKTTVAIIEANLMYALLVQLSKTLLKRDDPEDNTIKLFPGFEMKWYWQIAEQFINTNISMFPVGKELYGWLIHGYEIEGVNPMSSVNGFLSDIQGLRNADSIEDLRKGAKNVSMDLGVMFGVPVRNTYNLIYGLIKRVDAATTEQIDAYFTEKKAYAAKIGKAVEDGDERLLNTYLKIQSGQGNLPEIYNRLTMMGYDVLPRSVGTTFTYNGETYRMTNAERKQFREIYYQYSTVVSNMTRTKLWGNVSDEVKASAINLVQNTYWDLARDEITGEGDSNKVILFSEAIPIAKLCVAVAACRAMESDKDKKGNTIPGSKKVKVQKLVNSLDMTIPQKYMLMSFLGYKNVNGEKVVKAYINTLKGLSKSEKVQLGELCGVAA